jgi:lyso-ornithine lipid O-acyltransferase
VGAIVFPFSVLLAHRLHRVAEMPLRVSRRPFGRTRAVTGLAFALWRVPVWLLAKPGSRRAKELERTFFGKIVVSFGLDVRVMGVPAPSSLIVLNHISWVEIAVLASLLDADFVAKSEVGRWPFIGPLARRFGVILVAREKKIGSDEQAGAIRARLENGRSVILFPEGTTSDGVGVRPFRTSLFAAADTTQSVQPAVVRYLRMDGGPLSSRRRREVAWIDDDNLLEGAIRVAREHTRLEIEFLKPLESGAFDDRKALAEASRSAIVEAYSQAAAPPG